MLSSRIRTLAPVLVVTVLLAGWIGWLRAPSFGVTMWNVDESIHAAVARTLLEGGVMYRDAIDQRTPLTYYAFAGIFRVAGMNNLVAVRVVIAGIIVLTAALLFVSGSRFRNRTMGLFAAFIYAALTSHLLFPGDLYAAHTEWFVTLFTTLGSTLFLIAGSSPTAKRSFVIGACFGLAFLSKQPGLTDLGAPLATLAYAGLFGLLSWRAAMRSALMVLAGFGVSVAAALIPLIAAGAGKAMLFYTWTYNVAYYGPEVSWSTRLLSPAPFFIELYKRYPLVLVAGVAGAAAMAFRVLQHRPVRAVTSQPARECYLLIWCATSLVGAMSGGRGYDHYFFQCLPPFALMAAWGPGLVAEIWRTRSASFIRRTVSGVATIAALVLAVGLVRVPPAARKVTTPPLDPALGLAAFIREHSKPTDKIFAWGYNPDIYMYADRSPASRFVYCSFQTGLIPWTNEDPAIDTTYAIVPGAMDTLISDLKKNQPVFIVDCGVGPHRRFTKYPLRKFPALRDFVEAHYIEIDPGTFLPFGFRLLMRRDQPASVLPATEIFDDKERPAVLAPHIAGVGVTLVNVNAVMSSPDLERLALFVDGKEAGAVRFPPASAMNIQVPVGFDNTSSTPHRLQAVATRSGGRELLSDPWEITVMALDTSAAQQSAFALPKFAGEIKADGVRALYNPRVDTTDGARTFALHAPSLVSYHLPAGMKIARGRYGIPAGAYAAENKGPSDGAGFIIRAVTSDGKVHVLLDRVLNPARNPADRAPQNFSVALDRFSGPIRLEFEINAGPSGNAASDWTYWSDITLEASP